MAAYLLTQGECVHLTAGFNASTERLAETEYQSGCVVKEVSTRRIAAGLMQTPLSY